VREKLVLLGEKREAAVSKVAGSILYTFKRRKIKNLAHYNGVCFFLNTALSSTFTAERLIFQKAFLFLSFVHSQMMTE